MQDHHALTTISSLGTMKKVIEMRLHFILLSNQSLQAFTLSLLLCFIVAAKDASSAHFEAERK